MLTSVQKEILQTLINLYQSANGGSIKGEDIAENTDNSPEETAETSESTDNAAEEILEQFVIRCNLLEV